MWLISVALMGHNAYNNDVSAETNQSMEQSMSESTNGGAPAAPAKRKQQRAASGPRTVWVVMQILDESGKPIKFDKERVRILDVDVQPERMLETVATAEKDNGFFLRAVLHGRTPRASVATGSVAQVTAPQMQAAHSGVAPTAQRPT